MTEEIGKAYPKIPTNAWWKLRRKFQESIPGAVTPTYVANLLGMKPASARGNVIRALRMMGLVDDNDKPTQRANAWRLDDQYAGVCAAIRNEIYPQELRDVAPIAPIDPISVENWFLSSAGVGQNAARQYRQVYGFLTDATIPPETPVKKPTSRQRTPQNTRRGPDPVAAKPQSNQPAIPNPIQVDPSVHIAIQIYLNADTKPEQIDQIFAHMAKLIGK